MSVRHPAVIAAELAAARGGDFCAELEAHLLTGCVVSTPGLFVMARPMPRSADPADIWKRYEIDDCDAWFVWVGVGNARELLHLAPYRLPWIGWHRQGREWRDCHWLPTAALERRLNFRAPEIGIMPTECPNAGERSTRLAKLADGAAAPLS